MRSRTPTSTKLSEVVVTLRVRESGWEFQSSMRWTSFTDEVALGKQVLAAAVFIQIFDDGRTSQ